MSFKKIFDWNHDIFKLLFIGSSKSNYIYLIAMQTLIH